MNEIWDECEHGLPTVTCSFCRHPYVPPPKPEIERTIVARFMGHCPECNLPIVVGQVIAQMTDERWLHEECAEPESLR